MANLTQGSRPETPMPIGLELTVEHEVFGELVRTFVLPDFNVDQAQGLVNDSNASADEDNAEETPGSQNSAGGQGS